MTNDLAKTIAAACLEAIQSRPDTPTEQELADVVRPLLEQHDEQHAIEAWASKAVERGRYPSTQELYDARHVNSFKSGPCPADGCNGVVIRNSINNAGGCTCCGRGFAPNPTDEAW